MRIAFPGDIKAEDTDAAAADANIAARRDVQIEREIERRPGTLSRRSAAEFQKCGERHDGVRHRGLPFEQGELPGRALQA